MKAKTEEYAFQRLNRVQWRLGYLIEGTSKDITVAEYQEWCRNLKKQGYLMVYSNDGGDFQVWGREVEVDLE